MVGVRQFLASPSSYQLALQPSAALSVFGKLPHFLVPLVLGLFSLADQGDFFLQPFPAVRLVLLCRKLWDKNST